jgi:hypothetical protein
MWGNLKALVLQILCLSKHERSAAASPIVLTNLHVQRMTMQVDMPYQTATAKHHHCDDLADTRYNSNHITNTRTIANVTKQQALLKGFTCRLKLSTGSVMTLLMSAPVINGMATRRPAKASDSLLSSLLVSASSAIDSSVRDWSGSNAPEIDCTERSETATHV